MSDAQPTSEQVRKHVDNFGDSRVPTQWKPGKSGNPAGRPKGIEKLAREHTEAAIATLVRELNNPRNCVPAAVALLDRGWGKPKQTIQGDPDSPVQFVIRGPTPVESAEDWLKQYAPKTIEYTDVDTHTDVDTDK